MITKERYKGFKIEIVADPYPESPREWDNLGTMFCSHSRYTLGDEQFKSGRFSGWEDVEQYLIKERGAAVILPLYLYDHSGITMSVGKFNDPWDSGQVGFIFVTKDELRKEYRKKQITRKLMEQAAKVLEGEVETYDQYLRGDVYGFRVLDKDDEEIESAWGFFGTKDALEDAKDVVNYQVQHQKETRAKQRQEFKQAWSGYPEEYTEPEKFVPEVDYREE